MLEGAGGVVVWGAVAPPFPCHPSHFPHIYRCEPDLPHPQTRIPAQERREACPPLRQSGKSFEQEAFNGRQGGWQGCTREIREGWNVCGWKETHCRRSTEKVGEVSRKAEIQEDRENTGKEKRQSVLIASSNKAFPI